MDNPGVQTKSTPALQSHMHMVGTGACHCFYWTAVYPEIAIPVLVFGIKDPHGHP